MEIIIIMFQVAAVIVLVGLAIYSGVYFTQITKIEQQFGLRIPNVFKKILAILMMIPMATSLVVLIVILVEIPVY